MIRRHNPHPWAKYRQAAGFTQAEIASRLNVSRHYLLRLERSLFSDPPRLTTVQLALWYGIELSTFEESYYQYVRTTREEFASNHVEPEIIFNDEGHYDNEGYFLKVHPLVAYRVYYDLSRMAFCTGLCLHYDTVTEFEKNKIRALPDQIKEAFAEINWSWIALGTAVADWRRRGNADKSSPVH